MAKTVEFLFDFVSPTTYFAHLRMPEISRRTGADIQYKPIYLGGVMKATGNSPPAAVPAKGAYLMRDLARFAERDGFDYSFNPNFPMSTMSVLRIAVGLADDKRQALFIDAVFLAMWRDAKNLADSEVIRQLIVDANLDPDELMSLVGDQQAKDGLRANTEYAVSKGVFGAPSFLVGNELFFGQDRTDWVEHYLTSERGEE